MGPRTLCNACGLIWAKLARKKSQSGDRFKLPREDSPQHQVSASGEAFTFNFSADPTARQPSSTVESSSSSLEPYHSIQDSQVEPDTRRPNTQSSRTDDSRGDKFKLSFLLDWWKSRGGDTHLNTQPSIFLFLSFNIPTPLLSICTIPLHAFVL